MTALKNNTADLIWKSPGSGVELISLQVSQTLSDLYVIRAEIRSEEKGLKPADLLHADAKIAIKCGDELKDERLLCGIITRFAQKRTRHGNLQNASGKNYLYHVEIRPKMWMLVRQYRSKVFQNKNAQGIVSEVLDTYGITYKWDLGPSPKDRKYTVQYEESDYAFVSRLLEDEGICFFFDHEADKVVFSNHAKGHPDCKPKAKAEYVEEISPRFQFGKHEFVRDFVYEETVGTGAFALNHYNPETSQMSLMADTTEGEPPCFPEVEVYEHTRNYKDKGEGVYYNDLRREEQVARMKIGRGATSCRSLEAGHTMTLEGHFRDELNCKWLITSCTISMSHGDFHCKYTALPADVTFRPPRKTPRPKVLGLQTATVTGPKGSKVYLNDMGCCKLQFHWDREGKKDDSASMWVRVSNNYAGKDYGIQWIPRVGHEVLVTFVNGDPDQPIVTGRVYNDYNSAPLGPALKWQNIIKSIKDNHIMFDDEDDKELVDIRAEKDMNTLVINDKSITVGHDMTTTVGNDSKETVKKNKSVTVEEEDYTETVGRDKTVTVKKNIKVDSETGAIDTAAPKKISFTCGGSKITMDPKSITLELGGNKITINPGGVFVKGTLIKLN